MPEELKVGCTRPATEEPKEESKETQKQVEKKEEMQMIQVGKPAPLFSAAAYHKGNFINLKLEEFKGKWVLLCFYPGDFTFV